MSIIGPLSFAIFAPFFVKTFVIVVLTTTWFLVWELKEVLLSPEEMLQYL